MKKIVSLVLLSIILMAMVACTSVTPIAATSNPLGSKVGEASIFVLFNYLSLGGDRGIAKAAQNGGITKISTVDQKVVIGIFGTTFYTVVTGE